MTREELEDIIKRMMFCRAYCEAFDAKLYADVFKAIGTARDAIPRPISEAPKDGTAIVGRENNFWYVASWSGDEEYGRWVDGECWDRDFDVFIPVPVIPKS